MDEGIDIIPMEACDAASDGAGATDEEEDNEDDDEEEDETSAGSMTA